VLLTNRMDWSAEEISAAYAGQQQVEQVFQELTTCGRSLCKSTSLPAPTP
jgi:IS4 transposase